MITKDQKFLLIFYLRDTRRTPVILFARATMPTLQPQTIMSTPLNAAQAVLAIPDLAHMIFKPVQAHWKRYKEQWEQARRCKRLMHKEKSVQCIGNNIYNTGEGR